MSDRDIDINLASSTDTRVSSENVNQISEEEFKVRVAQVLDRGWAIDRFNVNLPNDVWGEWVPRDPLTIARMETLGFSIDKKHAVNRKLNDVADGSAVIGDVVFMTQPRWMHEIIETQRRENYKRTHLNTRKQKEEQDYEATIRHDVGHIEPKINSTAAQASGPEITEALTPKEK